MTIRYQVWTRWHDQQICNAVPGTMTIEEIEAAIVCGALAVDHPEGVRLEWQRAATPSGQLGIEVVMIPEDE